MTNTKRLFLSVDKGELAAAGRVGDKSARSRVAATAGAVVAAARADLEAQRAHLCRSIFTRNFMTTGKLPKYDERSDGVNVKSKSVSYARLHAYPRPAHGGKGAQEGATQKGISAKLAHVARLHDRVTLIERAISDLK